ISALVALCLSTVSRFPYTTLFRSVPQARVGTDQAVARNGDLRVPEVALKHHPGGRRGSGQWVVRGGLQVADHRGEQFVVFGEEDVFLRTETTEQATPAHTGRCGHTVHGRGAETMSGAPSHRPPNDL